MAKQLVDVDISSGGFNALITYESIPLLTDQFYQVRINALKNQVLTTQFAIEFVARQYLGKVDQPAQQKDHSEYELTGLYKELAAKPSNVVPPVWPALYRANMAVLRILSTDGGFDVPRGWMKDFDPMKMNTALTRQAAIATPVLVTLGVVGVALAAVTATAWWARGREEARAAVAIQTLKQAASVSALTQLALTYSNAGKPIPPALLSSIEGLGREEQSYMIPIALGVSAVGLVGAIGYGLATGAKKSKAKAVPKGDEKSDGDAKADKAAEELEKAGKGSNKPTKDAEKAKE